MTTDGRNAAIVRSTLDLGHNLGLDVVAEGIDDQATWDALEMHRCDIGQGYFVLPPSEPQILAAWAAARREA